MGWSMWGENKLLLRLYEALMGSIESGNRVKVSGQHCLPRD